MEGCRHTQDTLGEDHTPTAHPRSRTRVGSWRFRALTTHLYLSLTHTPTSTLHAAFFKASIQRAASPLAAVSHVAFVSQHGALRVHLQLRTPHHIPLQLLHTLTVDVDTPHWLSVCPCCTLHSHSDRSKSICWTSGENHWHEARSGN